MFGFKKIAAALVIATCFSAPALALGPVDMEVTLDYASAYIWRGLDQHPEGGDAIQPGISAAFSPIELLTISGGVWASYDMDMEKEWYEVDYYADASATFGIVGVSVGYIYYDFPNIDDAETAEVYGGVSVELPYSLSASTTLYWAIDDDFDGYYWATGIDYSRSLTEALEVSCSAYLGYADYETDAGDSIFSGITDYTFGIGLSQDLGMNVGLSVSANYVIVPDSDWQDDDEEFYVMTGFSYTF